MVEVGAGLNPTAGTLAAAEPAMSIGRSIHWAATTGKLLSGID